MSSNSVEVIWLLWKYLNTLPHSSPTNTRQPHHNPVSSYGSNYVSLPGFELTLFCTPGKASLSLWATWLHRPICVCLCPADFLTVTSKIIHYSKSHVTTSKVIKYFCCNLITSKVNKHFLLIFQKKSGHFKSRCICIRNSQDLTVGYTSVETSQAGLDLRTLQTPWKSSEPLSSMSCILLPTLIKALYIDFGLIEIKMCRAGFELTTPCESCHRLSFTKLWVTGHLKCVTKDLRF